MLWLVSRTILIHLQYLFKLKQIIPSLFNITSQRAINKNQFHTFKLLIMKNTCTQVTICFFTAKYKILQFYSNGHSFFLVKYEIRIVPFVLWLWNTKLLKLLRNCHFLFADKLKNLKLHPNWHSFFFFFFIEHETQNLK